MEDNRMSGAYRPAGQASARPRPPADRIAAAHAKRLRRGRIATAIVLSLVFILGILLGNLMGGRKAGAVEKTEELPGETSGTEPEILPTAPSIKYYNVPLTHGLQDYIYEVCLEEQVPMSLIIAMIDQESHFTPDIVSDTGDMGLMQINSINYGYLEEEYHCADMLNPYQNVFCGIKIIGTYLHKYSNYHMALMAYNMGEYGAQKAWEDGTRSTSYSDGVISLAEQYEDEVGASANGLGLGLFST